MATQTEKQGRLAILKDARGQIGIAYNAAPGKLIDSDELDEAIATISYTGELGTLDARKFLKNFLRNESCEVCARGALLLSTIAVHNDCTIKQLGGISDDGGKVNARLRRFFTSKQINMMEAAFEGHSYHVSRLTKEESDACDRFYDEYEGDADNRLEAILDNAIDNKGEFKP